MQVRSTDDIPRTTVQPSDKPTFYHKGAALYSVLYLLLQAFLPYSHFLTLVSIYISSHAYVVNNTAFRVSLLYCQRYDGCGIMTIVAFTQPCFVSCLWLSALTGLSYDNTVAQF